MWPFHRISDEASISIFIGDCLDCKLRTVSFLVEGSIPSMNKHQREPRDNKKPRDKKKKLQDSVFKRRDLNVLFRPCLIRWNQGSQQACGNLTCVLDQMKFESCFQRGCVFSHSCVLLRLDPSLLTTTTSMRSALARAPRPTHSHPCLYLMPQRYLITIPEIVNHFLELILLICKINCSQGLKFRICYNV